MAAPLPRSAKDLADVLADLGLPRPQALVCLYLAVRGQATSQELQEALSLRQPEISIATRHLRRAGWVEAESQPTEGRGRPRLEYRCRVEPLEIVHRLETERRQEIRATEGRLKQARDLAAQVAPRRSA